MKIDQPKEAETTVSTETSTEVPPRDGNSENQTAQDAQQKKFVLTHDYIHQSK